MQKNTRTILFLAPYPSGQAPSQRFRFEQYLDLLRDNGYVVRFQSFLSEKGWRLLYTKGNLVQKAAAIVAGFVRRAGLFFGSLSGVDAVFIHREATPVGPPWVEFLISRVWNKPVVYDFDDAIWLPNTSEENQAAAWLKWHRKVKSICRWSYRVSAGNQFLADFARQYNQHVAVNPTTVDTNRHQRASSELKKTDTVTLGWTGSHSTLRYLDEFGPIWNELVSHFGARIRLLLIADRNPGFTWPQWEFAPWTKETEIEELQRIDIGLMPLTQDAWSEGKCGLKALQYMALAIPTVASPVGVNRKIIKDGENGLLCESPKAWREAIVKLVNDPAMRQRLGNAGRQTVADGFSVTSNASNFLSLFP